MKKSDFDSLQRGMAEAKAYLEGERRGYVVHEPVDVRQVRASTQLTRSAFAARYRLDPRAVEQWEQGRRRPEKGTEMYLRLIGRDPEGIAEMVSAMEETTPGIVRERHTAREREMATVAEGRMPYQAEEQAPQQANATKPRLRSRGKWSKPGIKQLRAGEAEFGLRDRHPALLLS